MNDRAELMQGIAIGLEYTHSAAASTSRRYGGGAFAEIHGVFDLGGIADHLIEQGWRKVDPAADTRVEWAIHDHLDGVTSPVGQLNAEERTRMFAKHRPHISVRSRDVITTPWREVES